MTRDWVRPVGGKPVGPKEAAGPPRADVWRMFDRIAPRYDLLNRLLSFRRDVTWRNRLRRHLPGRDDVQVLDVATGTGDVIVSLLTGLQPAAWVVGVDLSPQMLQLARAKLASQGLAGKACLIRSNAESLPFRDDSFDVVTIAFGIRNVLNTSHALSEMYRVLLPNGKALVLEFSLPSNPIIRKLYPFHLRGILPRVGALISGDRHAYRYLHETVETYPHGEVFLARMRQAGFTAVDADRLTCGIATIYHGVKAHGS